MRQRIGIGLTILALLFAGVPARRGAHGLSLVVRAADFHGTLRRFADLDTVSVAERLVPMPLGDVTIRARIYAPDRAARQTVLLVSGLHPAGIDEPRLRTLARALAESNVTVVTPEIPELMQFEITPTLTDRIEAAAVWLARQPRLAPSGRIGLMGVSFAGGLAVVAAGRPALRGHLLYVFSLGGHDDLRRVVEYFCAGAWSNPAGDDRAMSGTIENGAGPPHDYGVAVVLLNVAERVVPPEQVAPLRDGIRRFLWASYLDRLDKPRAQREFSAVRDLARTLPEPSASLLGYVSERDVAHLGPRLLPYIGSYVQTRALSPALSADPSAPVFLLHGRDDNVIPAAESWHLADRLRGKAPVRLLVTDLISHAEADRPARALDVLRLARFWGDILAR